VTLTAGRLAGERARLPVVGRPGENGLRHGVQKGRATQAARAPTQGRQPGDQEREHRTEQREVFGSRPMWIVLGRLVVLLLGWLLVTP
jgi:hypothetical protein